MKINQSDLEAVLRRINVAAGFGESPKWGTPGSYVLDGAYGGWRLDQFVNESGGIKTITSGYVPKRELYYLMHAYLSGMTVKVAQNA